MNKKEIRVWGRNFLLNVDVECYDGESVLDSQTNALNQFLANIDCIEKSKQTVEKYIIEKNKKEFSTSKVDNIFKYVIPYSIFVPHNKKCSSVAIMCNYKFDEEHGLAIVFENGKFKKIGRQDIIL